MNLTVPMALADYIPVILFGISALYLLRDLYNKMSKGAYSLFSAGVLDVFGAGVLKATWKLLYAAGVCDFARLNQMFFPVQALGFMLTGLGIVAMLTHKQGEGKTYAIVPVVSSYGILLAAGKVPPVFSGTIIFVLLMVCGIGMLYAGMCVLAVKMKKKSTVILFVLAFIFSLGMGYLSSKDFTKSSMNWIAEFVNLLGQGCFLAGTLILHKNGLKSFETEEKSR